MVIINKTKNVKRQFSNDKNLITRIDFYKKYTTNKYKFSDWLFDKYKFNENQYILELGCGNGNHWEGRIEKLPQGCRIVLSDFSDGMLKLVNEKFCLLHNVSVQKIDIQSIPFESNLFDVVIANHMLFHVPNLNKALLEVKRVLKKGGCFYSATDGDGGMRPFLHNAIKKFDVHSKAFTEKLPFSLQNGDKILSKFFNSVKKFTYENVLSVTKTEDLMNWLKSTCSISGFSEKNFIELYEYFENVRLTNGGAIKIPRETGIFISVK